jgi:hypothetical protein
VQVIDPAHEVGAEVTCIAVCAPGVDGQECVGESLMIRLSVCVQVAHNSDIMATGGTDHNIRIWDIRMGKALQDCAGHSGKVRFGVTFSNLTADHHPEHAPCVCRSAGSGSAQMTSKWCLWETMDACLCGMCTLELPNGLATQNETWVNFVELFHSRWGGFDFLGWVFSFFSVGFRLYTVLPPSYSYSFNGVREWRHRQPF